MKYWEARQGTKLFFYFSSSWVQDRFCYRMPNNKIQMLPSSVFRNSEFGNKSNPNGKMPKPSSATLNQNWDFGL
jgi:hypothetical protein